MSHFGSKNHIWILDKRRAAAFIQLARLLRDGEVVGITPDGPKGPHAGEQRCRVPGESRRRTDRTADICEFFRMYSEVGIVLSCRCRLAGAYFSGTDLRRQDGDDHYFEEKRVEVELFLRSAYAAGGLVDGPPGYRSRRRRRLGRLNEYECPLGISTLTDASKLFALKASFGGVQRTGKRRPQPFG